MLPLTLSPSPKKPPVNSTSPTKGFWRPQQQQQQHSRGNSQASYYTAASDGAAAAAAADVVFSVSQSPSFRSLSEATEDGGGGAAASAAAPAAAPAMPGRGSGRDIDELRRQHRTEVTSLRETLEAHKAKLREAQTMLRRCSTSPASSSASASASAHTAVPPAAAAAATAASSSLASMQEQLHTSQQELHNFREEARVAAHDQTHRLAAAPPPACVEAPPSVAPISVAAAAAAAAAGCEDDDAPVFRQPSPRQSSSSLADDLTAFKRENSRLQAERKEDRQLLCKLIQERDTLLQHGSQSASSGSASPPLYSAVAGGTHAAVAARGVSEGSSASVYTAGDSLSPSPPPATAPPAAVAAASAAEASMSQVTSILQQMKWSAGVGGGGGADAWRAPQQAQRRPPSVSVESTDSVGKESILGTFACPGVAAAAPAVVPAAAPVAAAAPAPRSLSGASALPSFEHFFSSATLLRT